MMNFPCKFYYSAGKKAFLAVLTLTLLMACAPRTVPLPDSPARNPDVFWNKLHLSNSQMQAFQATVSINYIEGKKRYRLTGQLWGNTNGPLRLDLRAGIGKLVGMIFENKNSWLFYNALEKTAYQGQADFIRQETGISFPFSLRILGKVLFGNVKEILPPDYQYVTTTKHAETIYSFQNGKNIHTLKVGPTGLPMEFHTETWQITWPGWETGTTPPSLRIKNKQAAIFLRLKDYTAYSKKRPRSETELILPPDIPVFYH